jgi:hypothetical protein
MSDTLPVLTPAVPGSVLQPRVVAVPSPVAAANAAVRDIRNLGYTDIRIHADEDSVVVTGAGLPGLRFTPLRPSAGARPLRPHGGRRHERTLPLR